MALAIAVRFDLIDNKGKTSFTKLRVPTTFSIAQYIEFAQSAAQTIADNSNCQITNVSLTFGIDTSGIGLKTVANALSDVYQKGLFIFTTAVAGFKAKFRVPTLDESKVILGSDALDQVDVSMASFLAAEENGILITGPLTVQPTDGRGNDVTSLQEAREIHRKKI